MTRLKYADMDCSIARTLQIMGEHWSMLIVKNAMFGTSRFSDFQRVLGVARNILTDRLNHLVDNGILERYVAQPGGLRQHYRLTPKGRDLTPVLIAMMQWGDRWTVDGDNHPITVVNRNNGQPIGTIEVVDCRGISLKLEDLEFVVSKETKEAA